MRDLTQQEIDNKPDWSDRYMILGGVLFYVDKVDQLEFGKHRVHKLYFDYEKCKPIQTKQFDITKHEFQDSITGLKAEISDENLVIQFQNGAPNWTFFSKDDVAAMANHFKLI